MSDLMRSFKAVVFKNYYPRGEKQTFVISATSARNALDIVLAKCPDIRRCEVVLQHGLSGDDWVYAEHGFFDGYVDVRVI